MSFTRMATWCNSRAFMVRSGRHSRSTGAPGLIRAEDAAKVGADLAQRHARLDARQDPSGEVVGAARCVDEVGAGGGGAFGVAARAEGAEPAALPLGHALVQLE